MPAPQTPSAAIAHHESMAEMYEADASRLEAQYGKGVRPGWVGEDISIASAAAKRHRAAADAWRARAAEELSPTAGEPT